MAIAALYDAETGTVQNVGWKYLESFEMWCWRRMEVSWTDRVRNEQISYTAKGNCLLKHVIGGKMER
jgi:hypothetical protein